MLATPTASAAITAKAGRVILAIDGLQPDVGHEVLWVIRDVLSGEVLLARSLLSSCRDDLAKLLGEVKAALRVPIAGVVSDGQASIRDAVAAALPGVPHQLCQFHYLREAARPVYEADRHAKVALKKKVRGIRPIEREVEGRDDAEAEAIRGYCAAVRSALTDDGRPPLEASGLKLHDRLAAGRREPRPGRRQKGLPKELTRLRAILGKGLEATEASWPEIREAFGWVRRLAAVLANKTGHDAAAVRTRFDAPIAASARHRGALGSLAGAFDHFRKVTRSYSARPLRLLRRGGTCRGRTTTWSSSSARTAITSGGAAAGRWRARGRWCGARCGWWPRRRPGCVRSRFGPGPVRPDGLAGPSRSLGRRRAVRTSAAASAATRRPTSSRLRIRSSIRLCHPSFFRPRGPLGRRPTTPIPMLWPLGSG